MDELLSLKWNNHNSSFIKTLSHLRAKDTYTDVTLACEGKLYNAHKFILSTCSDYFSNIFESINCKMPVVILKDIKCKELEALLDYMYLGEVNVSQIDLAPLIKTAECLQLKGLAVPDENDKRKTEAPISSSRRKRLKVQDNNHTTSPSPTIEKNSSYTENNIVLEKSEISIKDEAPDYEFIDAAKEEFSPYDLENDAHNNIKMDQSSVDDSISENLFEPEPGSDVWRDVNPEAVSETLSSFPKTLDESFDMPTGSGQRNTNSNNISIAMPCPFCQKSMLAYDLRRHMRTHTGEKPFGCPHCDFWASRKTSTIRHMIRMHNDSERNTIKVVGDIIGT